MLVKNYKKCNIVNAFKNNIDFVQESDDFSEPLDAKFICASSIHEHCRSADGTNEIAVLRGKFPSGKSIDYILYAHNGGAVQCCEFSYKKLKDIVAGFENIEIIIELDDGAIAETSWELIFEKKYNGLALNEITHPLPNAPYYMTPWMRSFLSQLNKKFNYYIDSEGENANNLPLLSSMVLTFGWEAVQSILDAYPRVDDSPLVNKTWAENHPIIYISAEINSPQKLLDIHMKYFERMVKYDDVFFNAVRLARR